MTNTVRRTILKANALYLGVAACMGLVGLDLRGVLTGGGPEGRVLALAPDAAIGFFEAHGLALILAIALWRAPAARSVALHRRRRVRAARRVQPGVLAHVHRERRARARLRDDNAALRRRGRPVRGGPDRDRRCVAIGTVEPAQSAI